MVHSIHSLGGYITHILQSCLTAHTGGKNCSATQDGPDSLDLQLGGDIFLVYSVIIAVMTTVVSVVYILTIIALCSVRSMADTADFPHQPPIRCTCYSC